VSDSDSNLLLELLRGQQVSDSDSNLLLELLSFREGNRCLTVTVTSDVLYSGVPNFHFPNSKLRDNFPMYHEH